MMEREKGIGALTRAETSAQEARGTHRLAPIDKIALLIRRASIGSATRFLPLSLEVLRSTRFSSHKVGETSLRFFYPSMI